MIIKNTAQFNNAEIRREAIRKKIEEYREYTGIQYELYAQPLIIEMQELDGRIQEFNKLTNLPLEQAISGVLSTPILIDNIGELLAKLRITAKKTQSEMAEILEWEQPNLSRFENENYNSQTISKIVEFASALGVYLLITPSLTEKPEPSLDVEHLTKIMKSQNREVITNSSDILPRDDDYDNNMHMVAPLSEDTLTEA